MTDKPKSVPPKSPLPPPTKEEIEAEAALDAACGAVSTAACELDETAKKLKRTISDSRMKAVRLPTPSQVEIEAAKPPK